MHTSSKSLCAATLGLALLFAVATSANAQSWGDRTSTKEKAAYIGGGAAAGALIGGLLGGKKGAIIGGLLGAGGGAGYVYYKGRDDRYDRSYDNDRRFNNQYRRDHDRDDRRFDQDRWSRAFQHR